MTLSSGLQILLNWSYDNNSSSSRCGSNSSIPSIIPSYQSKRTSWNSSNFSKNIDFTRPSVPHQESNLADHQSRRGWINGSNDSLLNTSNQHHLQNNNSNSNHNYNNYNVEKYNSCPNLNYTFANALRLSHFDDEELGEVHNNFFFFSYKIYSRVSLFYYYYFFFMFQSVSSI